MPVEGSKGPLRTEKKDKDGVGTYSKKRKAYNRSVTRSKKSIPARGLFIKPRPAYHQTVESRFSTSSTGSV
jgi:hypothetical protein